MATKATGTWLLKSAPAYTFGGRLADAAYPCGHLILEMGTDKASEISMQAISGATVSDFNKYTALLASEGFTPIFENALEKNRFATFEKVGIRVLVSYFANDKRLTVTEDHSPHAAAALSDTAAGDGRCEFFAYGLNMDPGGHHDRKQFAHLNTSGYPNCGMLLAMTCGDGRVIVIDGGYAYQLDKNGAIGALDRFLHQITGKDEDEVVTVAAWYVTHNHPDHHQGFTYLLKSFPTRYRVERIIGNIPDTSAFPKMSIAGLTSLGEVVREQSPDCREAKVHTGDVITLGNVTLEVLYTHEDAVHGETGEKRVKDFNDTTTVIKATLGKETPMTVMILGDISELSEERMVMAFTKKTLKCDIAQEAHHNFNYITELYRLISAPVMCFIQTEYGTIKTEKLAEHAAAAKKYSKKYYYNGDITKTVGFAKIDGKVKEVYRYLSYHE